MCSLTVNICLFPLYKNRSHQQKEPINMNKQFNENIKEYETTKCTEKHTRTQCQHERMKKPKNEKETQNRYRHFKNRSKSMKK